MSQEQSPERPPLKQRLNTLLETYGQVALVTWLTIFATVMLGFVVAIKFGYQPESATGQTGVLIIAYAATQATKPLRILATLALTPVVARFISREK